MDAGHCVVILLLITTAARHFNWGANKLIGLHVAYAFDL